MLSNLQVLGVETLRKLKKDYYRLRLYISKLFIRFYTYVVMWGAHFVKKNMDNAQSFIKKLKEEN